MVKVAPSLLAADFGELKKQVGLLEQAKADVLHLDVMDGHFVPNLTFVDEVIDKIHALGCKAGAALKPASGADVLAKVVDKLDLVLIMTVEPGFGGQKFMVDMLPKIKQVRNMIKTRDTILSVDGGINNETAIWAKEAGANMLVAGTYVFKSADWSKSIASLR